MELLLAAGVDEAVVVVLAGKTVAVVETLTAGRPASAVADTAAAGDLLGTAAAAAGRAFELG